MDYTELQEAIATWLDRDDLGAKLPLAIQFAEARLNDRLRLAGMEKTATLQTEGVTALTDEATGDILIDETTGDILIDESPSGILIGSAQLPDDFLELRMVLAATSPRVVLKLGTPNGATNMYGTLSSWPDIYTIIGSTLATYPLTSADLMLTYYARIPTLTNDAPTNWLLTRYPQMYLYAACLELVPAFADDTRVVLWKAALDEAINDAHNSDRGTRYANAGLRLSGPTP